MNVDEKLRPLDGDNLQHILCNTMRKNFPTRFPIALTGYTLATPIIFLSRSNSAMCRRAVCMLMNVGQLRRVLHA